MKQPQTPIPRPSHNGQCFETHIRAVVIVKNTKISRKNARTTNTPLCLHGVLDQRNFSFDERPPSPGTSEKATIAKTRFRVLRVHGFDTHHGLLEMGYLSMKGRAFRTSLKLKWY